MSSSHQPSSNGSVLQGLPISKYELLDRSNSQVLPIQRTRISFLRFLDDRPLDIETILSAHGSRPYTLDELNYYEPGN